MQSFLAFLKVKLGFRCINEGRYTDITTAYAVSGAM
jgi:hypothetical protein